MSPSVHLGEIDLSAGLPIVLSLSRSDAAQILEQLAHDAYGAHAGGDAVRSLLRRIRTALEAEPWPVYGQSSIVDCRSKFSAINLVPASEAIDSPLFPTNRTIREGSTGAMVCSICGLEEYEHRREALDHRFPFSRTEKAAARVVKWLSRGRDGWSNYVLGEWDGPWYKPQRPNT